MLPMLCTVLRRLVLLAFVLLAFVAACIFLCFTGCRHLYLGALAQFVRAVGNDQIISCNFSYNCR